MKVVILNTVASTNNIILRVAMHPTKDRIVGFVVYDRLRKNYRVLNDDFRTLGTPDSIEASMTLLNKQMVQNAL